MTDKHYAERDAMQLDRDGNYYCRHVAAMTAEGLHKKSDIAAELAWRDREIDRLQREAAGDGEECCGHPYRSSGAGYPECHCETQAGLPLRGHHPASAEPGCVIRLGADDWNPYELLDIARLHVPTNDLLLDRIKECLRQQRAAQSAPEARGGGEAFGWWIECLGTDDDFGQFVRDPKFIETLRTHGIVKTATPLFTHPTPAALDAEKRLPFAFWNATNRRFFWFDNGIGAPVELSGIHAVYLHPASPPDYDGSHVGIEDRPDLWPAWVHRVVGEAIESPDRITDEMVSAAHCAYFDFAEPSEVEAACMRSALVAAWITAPVTAREQRIENAAIRLYNDSLPRDAHNLHVRAWSELKPHQRQQWLDAARATTGENGNG